VTTGTREPLVVLLLAGIVTYLLAFASWRLVEQPSLALKGRLRRRDRHPASPAPRTRIVVPGGRRAPSLARAELDRRLGTLLTTDDLATVRLLASELVSNSVCHGAVDRSGWVQLTVAYGGSTVRVETRDSGVQGQPASRAPSLETASGFGLTIIDRLATRWAAEHDPGLCVWFELEVRTPGTVDPNGSDPEMRRTITPASQGDCRPAGDSPHPAPGTGSRSRARSRSASRRRVRGTCAADGFRGVPRYLRGELPGRRSAIRPSGSIDA
jgi:anti-sigma regulatory factor (Ser/Thr protein kinase)